MRATAFRATLAALSFIAAPPSVAGEQPAPIPDTMLAVAYDRGGGPEVLSAHRLPVPQPAADEVLIPDRKDKHSPKPEDAFRTPFLVRMDNRLGVRAGPEEVSTSGELLAQFLKVVHLTVEDDLYGAVFVCPSVAVRWRDR